MKQFMAMLALGLLAPAEVHGQRLLEQKLLGASGSREECARRVAEGGPYMVLMTAGRFSSHPQEQARTEVTATPGEVVVTTEYRGSQGWRRTVNTCDGGASILRIYAVDGPTVRPPEPDGTRVTLRRDAERHPNNDQCIGHLMSAAYLSLIVSLNKPKSDGPDWEKTSISSERDSIAVAFSSGTTGGPTRVITTTCVGGISKEVTKSNASSPSFSPPSPPSQSPSPRREVAPDFQRG